MRFGDHPPAPQAAQRVGDPAPIAQGRGGRHDFGRLDVDLPTDDEVRDLVVDGGEVFATGVSASGVSELFVTARNGTETTA